MNSDEDFVRGQTQQNEGKEMKKKYLTIVTVTLKAGGCP